MSFARIFRWIATLAVILLVLKLLHISPLDLWHASQSKVENFKQDTLDITSGKAVSDIRQQARSESKDIMAANPAGNNEMSRELQAERTRIMEAKFNALQDPKLTTTDKSQLSEKMLKSSQQASGGN